jgi:hypothetical protein
MEVATEPQMSAAQSEKGKREADEEVRTLNRVGSALPFYATNALPPKLSCKKVEQQSSRPKRRVALQTKSNINQAGSPH